MNIKNKKTLEKTNVPFCENRVGYWLDCKEAASFLSLSPNALRIMVFRNQFPAYRLGKRLRFWSEDCRLLLNSKKE